MNLAEQWNPSYKPSHKRRTPKRANRGKFSADTIQRITERDNGLCVRCKSPYIESVPHHVIYKSQGGRGTAENGVTTCRACHTWAHSCREGRRWFEKYAESSLSGRNEQE